MDGKRDRGDGLSLISDKEDLLEDDEEEFRSCYGDDEDKVEEECEVSEKDLHELFEEELKKSPEGSEELVVEEEHDEEEDESGTSEVDLDDQSGIELQEGPGREDKELRIENPEICLDEHSVKLYFKGISVSGPGDSGSSGIGVVMERNISTTHMEVQKKLGFFVDQLTADYLALMDGLAHAAQNKIRRVCAVTDSEILYNQIMHEKAIENPLLIALRMRILDYVNDLEVFVLNVARSSSDLARALELARVAIGVVSQCLKGDESTERCPICCEDKLKSMIMTLKCSHKFCSHCLKAYVEGKVKSAEIPIRCPHLSCTGYISSVQCKYFLPVASYESLERILAEAYAFYKDRYICPYSSCLGYVDSHEYFSRRTCSLHDPDKKRMQCPSCQRYICVDCITPWHPSVTCERSQHLPLDERDAASQRRTCCLHCRSMIVPAHGCYRVTCEGCGYEFCYSCGAEYSDGEQTCKCRFRDENYYPRELPPHLQRLDDQHLGWDSFQPVPMIMDAYSDEERSQLELIQRFLAGSFSLTAATTTTADHHQPHPPPPSQAYADPMKDLHQLPWLERFVSLINDNSYYEDTLQ
ncbi:hypothetical protein DM860_002104 [Cuscuta australis]|uniref:RBR-type E3 ubiquitin transferase n=1 Tax=Cuscuta australis TaxID=267555 RepID=A0A328E082_9ASTE|nr:hypothetical protein DM860_002104 [Cuscuta australis]